MTDPLAGQTLEAFLDALASAKPAPGAGAAGAVALALAAACAGKAAAISLHHATDDATLRALRDELATLRARALALATDDARSFERHLREGDDSSAAALATTGERLLGLAGELRACCTALQGRVRPNMAGDVVAAAALAEAGGRIQHRNLDETDSGAAAEAERPCGFQELVRRSGWSAAELAGELDLDPRMIDAWCAGEEQPPRAVELAIRQLAGRHERQAAAASGEGPLAPVSGRDQNES